MNVTILNYVTIVYLQLLWHQLTSRTLFVTDPCATTCHDLVNSSWPEIYRGGLKALHSSSKVLGRDHGSHGSLELRLFWWHVAHIKTLLGKGNPDQPWVFLVVDLVQKNVEHQITPCPLCPPNCRLVQRCFKVGTCQWHQWPRQDCPICYNVIQLTTQTIPRKAAGRALGRPSSRLCGSFF